jgi:putative acetyltransferase
MSAVANPQFALRPFLAEDAAVVAEIFRSSIAELTGDDYSEAQREAWASLADDSENFGGDLSQELTLVATLAGSPVGFATLEGKDKIGMLYIHPAAVNQGAAALLIDALEKLAAGRGAGALKVDASDTAYGFFLRRGYAAQQRNTVSTGGEWLANTTMQKQLAKREAS